MVTQKTTINNPTGLHLRPAGLFCKTAVQFKSKISFQFKDITANAKSVLSVLGACIRRVTRNAELSKIQKSSGNGLPGKRMAKQADSEGANLV